MKGVKKGVKFKCIKEILSIISGRKIKPGASLTVSKVSNTLGFSMITFRGYPWIRFNTESVKFKELFKEVR